MKQNFKKFIIGFLSSVFALLVVQSKAQSENDQYEFWQLMRSNSNEYVKYEKNRSKLKSKCYIDIPPQTSIVDELERNYNIIPVESTIYSEYFLGKSRQSVLNIIVIENTGSLNASMNLSGVMTITKELIMLLTDDELLSIMAHEVAHFELNHLQIANFNKHRKERNNEIWAGIAIGMYATSISITDYNSARAGITPSISTEDKISNIIRNVLHGTEKATISYGYEYSRSQEFEADMAAAQFMDRFGKGRNNLISAFKKLIDACGDRYYTDIYDTHPTLSDRIRALEY